MQVKPEPISSAAVSQSNVSSEYFSHAQTLPLPQDCGVCADTDSTVRKDDEALQYGGGSGDTTASGPLHAIDSFPVSDGS